ncbi:MAG: peptidylprolyl isomerase [Acidobacteria bacterium]|nr:peptidylprolyl isomerase [Acidobacteriota bacterium]MBI3471812.1 peptidylprolyl isomerase [Candidatus Solibacter usitatus]
MWAQAPAAQAPAAAPAREPGLYATLNTSMGAIVAKLYEKEAPITVRNFVALSRGGKQWVDPKTKQPTTRPLYAGTIFHRVIPGFMIQGGDPEGTGYGSGGFKPIPDEFHPTLKFDQPGRLAMANSGPGTGTCQFFITVVPTPHLNGLHTIFGQVVEGQELATKIVNVPKRGDKPITPVRIVSIAIKREGPEPERPKPVMKKAAPAVKKAAPATK